MLGKCALLRLQFCPSFVDLSRHDSFRLLMTSRTPPSTPAPAEKRGELELAASIDNSRKRLLSPATFRGDQAVDRLLAQELSASPLLKKSKLKDIASLPSGKTVGQGPTMALTADEFRNTMKSIESNLNSRLDSVETRVAGASDSIRANSEKIDAQAKLIGDNRDSIATIRSELLMMKSVPRTSGSPQGRSYALAASSQAATDSEEERQFLLARRSARLWPIPGSRTDEIWQSARLFIHGKLGLDNIDEGCIELISRPEIPSGYGVRNEATILFKDQHVRDSVVGASSKLAAFVDTEGRPTAGIRMEVPRKLRSTFTTLYKFGQHLRRRHGEEFRRHVKFDDATMTLYLNVKLPGEDNWSKVSAEMARRGLRTRQIITDEDLERRLDATGPPRAVPRSRPNSVSSAETRMDTSNTEAARSWTGRSSVSSML